MTNQLTGLLAIKIINEDANIIYMQKESYNVTAKLSSKIS